MLSGLDGNLVVGLDSSGLPVQTVGGTALWLD